MLKNYFVIALRNLVNNPALSLIKIAGLSVGVCGCVVIFLIARYELSFDRDHPNADRIYRITTSFSGVWTGNNSGVPIPLAEFAREKLTGIETVAQFYTWNNEVAAIRASGDKFELQKNEGVILADSRYFDIFSAYKWISGSPDVLEQPNVVVLTDEQARVYFGSDALNAIGKRVIYRDSIEATVVGLIEPLKGNTDLKFTDIVSLATTRTAQLKEEFTGEWGSTSSNTQCFIKATPGTTPATLEEHMLTLKKARDDGSKSDEPETTSTHFNLQPLSDLHFSSIGIFDSSRTPISLKAIQGLMSLAVLLLVIAGINFVNLETAQGSRRGKEVGLRKVMGGTRRSLVSHFLSESLFLTTLAVVTAIPLAWLSLIFFDEFVPKGLTFRIGDPLLLGFLGGTILVVGTLSGLYPAVVLSSFQPAVALRNKMHGGGRSRSSILRKVLTVFQFSFSQALIVGALIVSLQISFMMNKDLGFTADAVVTISTPWYEKQPKREVLRNELNQVAGVLEITNHNRAPVARGNSSTTLTFKNGTDEIPETVYMFIGDTSYVSLFGLHLAVGRNVYPVDTLKEILINETYCEKLGMEPHDMIGRQIDGNGGKWTVVGVLEDFHFKSLHQKVEPIYFSYEPKATLFSMRLNSLENMSATVEEIKRASRKVFPDYEPNPVFIDDTVQKFYEQESRTAKLANTATGLAIFISCLGLFGLASFTAIQRTKEIGVRKVLGASVNNIVTLLSREFLVLVAVAFVIAVPLSWYAASEWLSNFAYRMDIGVWIFILAGLASVMVAFITVGYQALKAAVVNPVDSLRYE